MELLVFPNGTAHRYNKEHRLAFLESKPNPGESGVVTADMHVALAVEDTLHP